MKIIRCLTTDGRVGFAEQHADGRTTQLLGDVLEGLTATEEAISPATMLAPIDPTALLCIGLNYRQHALETNAPIPQFPVLFMKGINAVNAPGAPIILPRWLPSQKVDFECELAVVIGRACKNVSRTNALEYVLGYMCANDVSARDWQKEGGGTQWSRGKSFDTFAPLGPCLVTREEIPNPNALRIRTMVSGKTMQESSTSDMIFDVATLIEFLSGSTTLLPGTVILTGTPSGVGVARTPPRFLTAGDSVSVEIEGIGVLTNPVVEESVASAGPWRL